MDSEVTAGTATLQDRPPRAIPFPAEQSSLWFALPRYRGNPLARFADMRRRYPPVAGFRMLGRCLVVVHDPKAIEDILVRKHALFVKDSFTGQLSSVLGRGLLTSEGEHHRRQRRLIAPSLSAPEVAHYGDTIVEAAQRFADGLQDDSVVDVHALCMRVTLDVLTRALFGQRFEEYDLVDEEMAAIMTAFRPWPELFRAVTPEWVPLPSRRRLEQARMRLHGVVDRLIESKRRQPLGRDLLSRMLEANDEEGGLTDEDLRDQVITMLLAGHETTALSLCFTLRSLAVNREWRERVEHEVDEVLAQGSLARDAFAGMGVINAVLQESLRLYPPAWVIGRRALEDCVVGGWQLPQGQDLFIPVYTIHRDPRWFPNPDAFEPERFLPGGSFHTDKPPRFAYLPFGGGPRICVGSHFAMLEAQAILSVLVHRARFDWISGNPFGLAPSITLRPAFPMPMRVHLRAPADRSEIGRAGACSAVGGAPAAD